MWPHQEHFDDLKNQRGILQKWKPGYKRIAHACEDKIWKAKAQNELHLPKDIYIKGNKKRSKRKKKESVGPLLNGEGQLIDDIQKAKLFNA